MFAYTTIFLLDSLISKNNKSFCITPEKQIMRHNFSMKELWLDKDYPDSEHSYDNTFCQINQIFISKQWMLSIFMTQIHKIEHFKHKSTIELLLKTTSYILTTILQAWPDIRRSKASCHWSRLNWWEIILVGSTWKYKLYLQNILN